MISAAEYARLRGVSRNAVSKAIKAGRISTTTAPNGRVLIDADRADREWAANTDPHRQETGSIKDFAITERRARDANAREGRRKRNGSRLRRLPARPIAAHAKKRALQMRVALQELELATMRGELVSRTRSKRCCTEAHRGSPVLQSIPDRLSAMIAAEPSAETRRRLLMDEFARVLEMLAVDFEAPTFRRSN